MAEMLSADGRAAVFPTYAESAALARDADGGRDAG
jgi:hypothetical protein